jgi:hypothetical protein
VLSACKVPTEESPNVEEAHIQELSDSHATELTYEQLEQLTALTEPENKEHADAVVERSHLTTSTMKKGLQLVDDLVNYFFENYHFIDRCLK